MSIGSGALAPQKEAISSQEAGLKSHFRICATLKCHLQDFMEFMNEQKTNPTNLWQTKRGKIDG